jgi:lipopolysaccharide biosynthesis glycosyltransferase|tara:strand:- start:265 stop:1038 length:774 start_codon:yes stop_codon:yes gene_type:complete
MKNVVFIPNINLGNGRSDSYKYSVSSWKHWCDKNDVELIVWEDLIYPVDYMKITWQRYYMFDILEANDVDYDQILMVDADTIVHPDCPNFFNETDRKYCGVQVDGCYEWVTRSIRGFGDMLFEGKRIHPWRYINGGFQIVNKNHKSFFESMKEYYSNNSQNITTAIDTLKCGTDQTIVNYMLHQEKVDVNILPSCYNLQDLFRKNLLYVTGREWWTDELHFLEAGWVYHYNSIPQNPMNRDATYWIKRTYQELYGSL